MHDSKLEDADDLEKKLSESGFKQNKSHPAVWNNDSGIQVNTKKAEHCERVLNSLCPL